MRHDRTTENHAVEHDASDNMFNSIKRRQIVRASCRNLQTADADAVSPRPTPTDETEQSTWCVSTHESTYVSNVY